MNPKTCMNILTIFKWVTHKISVGCGFQAAIIKCRKYHVLYVFLLKPVAKDAKY